MALIFDSIVHRRIFSLSLFFFVFCFFFFFFFLLLCFQFLSLGYRKQNAQSREMPTAKTWMIITTKSNEFFHLLLLAWLFLFLLELSPFVPVDYESIGYKKETAKIKLNIFFFSFPFSSPSPSFPCSSPINFISQIKFFVMKMKVNVFESSYWPKSDADLNIESNHWKWPLIWIKLILNHEPVSVFRRDVCLFLSVSFGRRRFRAVCAPIESEPIIWHRRWIFIWKRFGNGFDWRRGDEFPMAWWPSDSKRKKPTKVSLKWK